MNVSRCAFTFFFFIGFLSNSKGQTFKFAFVSDTHIGGNTAAPDLRRTVEDINSNPELKCVVITGDITEFGSDDEIKLAKQILDSLNKPWHIIPGNHDSNWSESGANTFKKVFGAETFAFTESGFTFIGTSSGPNMRMGPGQIPRENVVWLDSVLTTIKDRRPLIFLNHYPQDSSMNNWYEVINRLKKKNIQLILHGHGHSNARHNFEGIPGVMGRSNLRAKDSIGGYNIVTFNNGTATFEERKPILKTLRKWLEVPLKSYDFKNDRTPYFRPSYAVNKNNPQVKVAWEFQDRSDVGAGTAASANMIFNTNTAGSIYALDKRTGKFLWRFRTGGKIYSTPTVSGNYLVVGSTDNNIYCLSASNGKLLWKYTAQKAVLGSPVIHDTNVYIGGSDGHFRAFNLKTGKMLWDFDQVKDFIVTRPLIYRNKIYFGSWGNDFYALDLNTGKLAWKWNNGSGNRMFSPAACYPVAAHGRIFIVAPDRHMTSLDAERGTVIWRKQAKGVRMRESMGISGDSSLVYIKTMDGQLKGVSTRADSMVISWTSKLQLPYELTPSAIVEAHNTVYVPSHSGLVSAIDRQSGDVIWQYKISNSLVNPITVIGKGQIVVSSMDGKLASLSYSSQKQTETKKIK